MTTSPGSLGKFSISLAVADLAASRGFYQRLGFTPVAGDGVRWQILGSDSATIGLFAGVLPRNTLTFNPGWDHDGRPLATFTDVRELQRRLRAAGVEPVTAADEASTGPASFMLVDPDGNPLLIDQHV